MTQQYFKITEIWSCWNKISMILCIKSSKSYFILPVILKMVPNLYIVPISQIYIIFNFTMNYITISYNFTFTYRSAFNAKIPTLTAEFPPRFMEEYPPCTGLPNRVQITPWCRFRAILCTNPPLSVERPQLNNILRDQSESEFHGLREWWLVERTKSTDETR